MATLTAEEILRRMGLPRIEGASQEADADAEDNSGEENSAEGNSKEEQPSNQSEPDEKISKGDDWQTKARKHERAAKAAQKRLAELEKKLEAVEEANKTEQEKALDKAREEAKAETKAEYEKQLRTERLHAAIARQAAGKFADVDDAIRLLDVGDDLFTDEGKVDTGALTKELDLLLERKPHLAATPGKPMGDGDGGKGEAAKGLSTDPEAHFQSIRRRKD